MPASLDVLLRQLHQLKELRDSGALSDEGYERRAAELLSGKAGEAEAAPSPEPGDSDERSSWSAKPSLSASTGGRIKGGSALTATPLGTAANSTAAPPVVSAQPSVGPASDLAAQEETTPRQPPPLRLSSRPSASAWAAEPDRNATDLPQKEERADRKAGRTRGKHLPESVKLPQPDTSSVEASQAADERPEAPLAPTTPKEHGGTFAAAPSQRWAATPGSPAARPSAEVALPAEPAAKAKRSRWRKSVKDAATTDAQQSPALIADAPPREEAEGREPLPGSLVPPPKLSSAEEAAPRFSASPAAAQSLFPSMGVAPSPVEEAVAGKPTKSKASRVRKRRTVRARRMIGESTASLEEGSEVTVETEVETTATSVSQATIDETPDVATDSEVFAETEAVESPSPGFEDLSVSAELPVAQTPEERPDLESSGAIAGSEQTDEASVLATDLEWRRRTFLPRRRRSNVEVQIEADSEPSNWTDVDLPGDVSPDRFEVQELPEADGSGSYWDISTRIVPKSRELVDDEEPVRHRDTYWRKSHRRY